MTTELHNKMCKKIAQLTKVIFELNIKAEEADLAIRESQRHRDKEVDIILEQSNNKIKEIEETVSFLNDKNELLMKDIDICRFTHSEQIEVERSKYVLSFETHKMHANDLITTFTKTIVNNDRKFTQRSDVLVGQISLLHSELKTKNEELKTAVDKRNKDIESLMLEHQRIAQALEADLTDTQEAHRLSKISNSKQNEFIDSLQLAVSTSEGNERTIQLDLESLKKQNNDLKEQVSLLSRQAELTRLQSESSAAVAASLHQQLKKQLDDSVSEIFKIKNDKDSEIKELYRTHSTEINHLVSRINSEQEKVAHCDMVIEDLSGNLQKTKESHSLRELSLNETIQFLQSELYSINERNNLLLILEKKQLQDEKQSHENYLIANEREKARMLSDTSDKLRAVQEHHERALSEERESFIQLQESNEKFIQSYESEKLIWTRKHDCITERLSASIIKSDVLIKERTELLSTIADLKLELSNTNSAIVESNEIINCKKNTINALKGENSDLLAQRNDLQQKLSEASQSLEKTQDENNQVSQRLSQFELEYKNLLKASKDDNEKYENDMTLLRQKYESMQTVCDSLKNDKIRIEKELIQSLQNCQSRRDEYLKAMNEVENKYSQQIKNQVKQIDIIIKEREEKLTAINKQHESAILQIRADHDSTITRMIEQHGIEQEQASKKHNDEIDCLKNKQYTEIIALKLLHEESEKRIKTESIKEYERYTKDVKSLDRKIEEMKINERSLLNRLELSEKSLLAEKKRLLISAEEKESTSMVLQDEYALSRRYVRELFLKHDHSLSEAHRDHAVSLADMKTAHSQHISVIKNESNIERVALLTNIGSLREKVVVLETRFESRPSRHEDLHEIKSLMNTVEEKQKTVEKLTAQLEHSKRELLNREENYNRVFNANPNIGTFNPLEARKALTRTICKKRV